MRGSHLTPVFLSSLKAYEDGFLSAYYFFGTIITGKVPGFWISTDTNAHIYFHDKLIAYVKLHTTHLEFIARRNGAMDSGCIDVTRDLLDEDTINIARKHGLIKSNFVEFDRLAKMTVKRQTPPEFFDDLFEYWTKKYSE